MATIVGQTKSPFKGGAYQYVRTTDRLPSIAVAGDQEDPLCTVKLFNPVGRGTWFIAGFDPDTGNAFGVADIFERELGDFNIHELAALRNRPFGLPIERDKWFKPQRVSELLHD